MEIWIWLYPAAISGTVSAMTSPVRFPSGTWLLTKSTMFTEIEYEATSNHVRNFTGIDIDPVSEFINGYSTSTAWSWERRWINPFFLMEWFALSVTLISNGISPIESKCTVILNRLTSFTPAGRVTVSFEVSVDKRSGFPLNVASFNSESSNTTPQTSYSLPNTFAIVVLSAAWSITIPGFAVSAGADATFQLFNLPLLVPVKSVSSFKKAAEVIFPSHSVIVLTDDSAVIS